MGEAIYAGALQVAALAEALQIRIQIFYDGPVLSPDLEDFEEGATHKIFEPEGATDAARRLTEHLAASGVEVESARAGLPSLEDVFIRRIRAAAADTPGPNEVTR